MDLERKRVAANSSKTGVVIGSVWDSRMKGGFKVFNGDAKNQETEKPTEKTTNLRSKQSSNGVGGGGTRKTWKSDGNSDGNERTPVQISKVRSESKKVLGELIDSIDGDGIKKSPVQLKKGRPEWNKVQSVSNSIDGNERSPVQRIIKTRFLSRKGSTSSELGDGIEKIKSISTKENEISDESNNGIEEIEIGNRDDDNEMKKTRSDCSQNSDELDVSEEKLMTVDLIEVKTLDTEDYAEEASNKATMEEHEEVNEERAIVVVKEIEHDSTIHKKKSSDVVIEDKKIHHRNERSNSISKTVRKLPSVVNHPRTISKPSKYLYLLQSFSLNFNQSYFNFIFNLQMNSHHREFLNPIANCRVCVSDLIMWRDVSKSALIFGLGAFAILSSSYTQDLNISFISVISYLSLIYLAAIFIFKSFIFRGSLETDDITDDEERVLGEEEAIWALKLFLPYINEFLLKVKALFSGDPATTMKMAVLLFTLARCGSSITIWKMAKLAFFGVFTVPKICSSYSSQLSAYGVFWIQRFKDAWDSCSQKKAVAFGVFTLVWNFSSIVARIWAVFMLLVAFKYYQQFMTKDDEVVEEEEPTTQRNQSSWQEQRNGVFITSTVSANLKKRS
ncbi:hypothetical protein E3N88_35862 [Mikania micrantha]|uniref:Reticulon-like protein n=1 Tax=Mikania micrantha TaxID=192012 RepID=A0A5N6M2G8_9ASTR|nr:hypothetical protein E3N88_35862 [Mikania micrantha]